MLVRRTPRAPLIAVSLAAAVLVLAGCDSGSDSGGGTDSASATGPSVIAPGEPGEAAETLSAADAEQRRAEDDSPNSADFSYARMMIEHHAQALEMTKLVPQRADSDKVQRLAERISAAQGPEIAAMDGWLKSNGEERADGSGADGHQHEAMPGMATEAQLKKLRAARGKAFDELFLKLMITHHDGAITMATEVKAEGNNLQIEEMADDVIAQQTSEIGRMRDML
ncbi:DUF305 domain-containing protein [Streptomyces poonensis]|uniref:Lipoprotein n=1 Tax=Streptomyces poonensis TaxID=68255 RepID=A0A918Q670_9ACTN|nr:DUF305 domain-containing protein [Streptomyces poonensis]GGZ35533.1 lipoprotein [Streptomyces poonensis]GLJ89606.1 lipoprotein [Streptomyces poonensis]